MQHYSSQCLCTIEDLERLSEDLQQNIVDIYKAKPFDEENIDTYEISSELNNEIIKSMNVSGLKEIIGADILAEKGIEISNIDTYRAMGNDYEFCDPTLGEADIEEAFSNCVNYPPPTLR